MNSSEPHRPITIPALETSSVEPTSGNTMDNCNRLAHDDLNLELDVANPLALDAERNGHAPADSCAPLLKPDGVLQSDGEHLSGLNQPQREAVEHFTGPILVLAGAGSGKTRVLTRRVVSLVRDHGVHPRHILAVTFTNKATEEMRHRLSSLLGERGKFLWVATFHSAALRMLRQFAVRLGYSNNFVVYDDQDSKGLIKQLLKEHNIDDKKLSADTFARAFDHAKNFYLSPAQLAQQASSPNERLMASMYQRYQDALHAANAFDFGDLLFKSVELLERCPEVLVHYRDLLHFILVDEFQDTNPVQYRFIRLLAEPRNNLLVVGDDDQSIYAFRGATISNILNFERDFKGAKVVRLEQNYRSTGNILEVANAVIKKNKTRKGKTLWTAAAQGAPVCTRVSDDETDEAQFVAQKISELKIGGRRYSDIAIFYRTNAQSRALEEALAVSGIPYRIFGGLKFYDRKEIKDMLAYLRLIVNPADVQAFARAVNTPTRGVGAQTAQAVQLEARSSGAVIVEAARRISSRSKGLTEFVNLMDELATLSNRVFPAELLEEIMKRSRYVARLIEEKDPTNESRLENLEELKAIARFMEFGAENPRQALENFLDRVALTAGSDIPVDEQSRQNGIQLDPNGAPAAQPEMVSLMTLHLAKGLEFPVVFFTGVEEGLVPHYRSLEDPVGMEEERRLCYVGITRAMEQLFISRAIMRGLFASGGNSGYRMVSRFAADMPEPCLEHLNGPFISTVFGGTGESRYFSDGGFERRNQGIKGSRFGDRSEGESLDQRTDLSGSRMMSKGTGVPRAPKSIAVGAIKAAVELAPLSGPLAQPQDLKPGTRVRHQSFGNGEVLETDGELDGNGQKFKVLIKFDGVQETKKLMFKFARLVLE
jgi:DNA helicase-2/ATP-dependent DNA helicase PcrA